MDKKKIIGIAVTLIAVAVAANLICRSSKNKTVGYLQDSSDKISFEEASDSFKKLEFDDPKKAAEYFSKSAVNHQTVKFFKFLQTKFKEFKTIEEHLEAVKLYLYSIMPQEDADKLFAIYKKYVEYENDLMNLMKKWRYPQSAEDALAYMDKIRDFRRESFGKEVADVMFGPEFKMKEYQIRRKTVIDDKNLYAKDKQDQLKKINQDMWGVDTDGSDSIARPYDKYQERLQIYSKDMSELSPDKRTDMDKKFREEIFPADVVKKFEDIDKMIAQEQRLEETYRAKEQKIMSDLNLKPEEKKEKINQLQNDTFGEEAEAFRRREAIRTTEKNFKK